MIGHPIPPGLRTYSNGKLLEQVVAEAFKLEGIDVKYGYFPGKEAMRMSKRENMMVPFPGTRLKNVRKTFVSIKYLKLKMKGGVFSS